MTNLTPEVLNHIERLRKENVELQQELKVRDEAIHQLACYLWVCDTEHQKGTNPDKLIEMYMKYARVAIDTARQESVWTREEE